MARTTSQLRRVWAPACPDADMTRLHVADFGVPTNGASIMVRQGTEEAFGALLAIMGAHGYRLRQADTGAYVCRAITGGRGYSLHAYGIAADCNWSTNPYSGRYQTDMPPAMVREILALYTRGGVRVFRWGGDWDYLPSSPHPHYDTMHYEIVASEAELAAGIVTPTPTPRREDDMIVYGATGNHVADLQELINAFLVATGSPLNDPLLLGGDGKFGDATVRAMENVIGRLRDQRFHQLGGAPGLGRSADPRAVSSPIVALMAAVIAERELPAA